MRPDVTVIVPWHVPRETSGMLDRALWSLDHQDIPVQVLPVDGTGQGAAWARNEGLFDPAVKTPWVAFLDSDDWAYPDHVSTLLRAATEREAELTFSYFTVHDAWEGARPDLDPLGVFGKTFDPEHPHQTTGTFLVRTAVARRLGGFRDQPEDRMIVGTGLRYGEDYDFVVRAARSGVRIVHVPRRTWAWHIGFHNTSGLPNRGDALTSREDST